VTSSTAAIARSARSRGDVVPASYLMTDHRDMPVRRASSSWESCFPRLALASLPGENCPHFCVIGMLQILHRVRCGCHRPVDYRRCHPHWHPAPSPSATTCRHSCHGHGYSSASRNPWQAAGRGSLRLPSGAPRPLRCPRSRTALVGCRAAQSGTAPAVGEQRRSPATPGGLQRSGSPVGPTEGLVHPRERVFARRE
jgi:hypothetical protein